MTMEDFLNRAHELGVDGVSLESCFFPSYDMGWFKELKAQLDEYKFDRVYAWGHPDGLERGQNWTAYNEMVTMIPYAKAIGGGRAGIIVPTGVATDDTTIMLAYSAMKLLPTGRRSKFSETRRAISSSAILPEIRKLWKFL